MDGRHPPTRDAYFPHGYPLLIPPDGVAPGLLPMHTLSMENTAGYLDFDDANRALLPPPVSSRSRRRQTQSSDHVKHRRTRSGCYTCRQRRVKCDETRPTCDRCRKGKRQCSYPDAAALNSPVSTRPPRSGKRKRSSPGTSSASGSEAEDETSAPLSAIPDEDEDLLSAAAAADDDDDDDDDRDDEPDDLSQSATSQNVLQSPAATRDESDKSADDRTTCDSSRGNPRSGRERRDSRQSIPPESSRRHSWASLAPDVRYYVRYHREHMTHHHYAFQHDGDDFVQTTLLEIALHDSSPALLYSIVAFAAYHHALSRDDDNISRFLSYYNTSITYLQQSLLKQHNLATLLTTLQLASIEEFLGDWENLLAHQRAAFQILTDLYTPRSITYDATRRNAVGWYMRFDFVAGMMCGVQSVLEREWFVAVADFHRRRARERSDDLGALFADYTSTSRLLARDAALLFAPGTQKSMGSANFRSAVERLTRESRDFERALETAFSDASCFVRSFPCAPQPSADDVVDYRDPRFLYAGELAALNFLLADFWAVELLFTHRAAEALGRPHSAAAAAAAAAAGDTTTVQLAQLATKTCKMFEAIQYGCEEGPLALLGCQVSLAVLALFLPRDQKHVSWCRRKLADIERMGYLFPPAYRDRMTELWAEDVSRSWLPHDQASLPCAVRTIKDFVSYRSSQPLDPYPARQQQRLSTDALAFQETGE